MRRGGGANSMFLRGGVGMRHFACHLFYLKHCLYIARYKRMRGYNVFALITDA